MGFLSNLFKHPNTQPASSARAEIERRIGLVSAGKAPVGELLFMGVVGVSKFFRPVFAFPDPEKERRYLSDQILYELGIFRIFTADLYLFTKHPYLRDRIVQFLHKEALALFGPHLRRDNSELTELLNDRMELYGDTFAKVGDPATNLLVLSQCIRDTAAHGSSRLRQQDIASVSGDALDRFAIDSGLTAWETNFLPLVCETLDEVVRLSKSQRF